MKSIALVLIITVWLSFALAEAEGNNEDVLIAPDYITAFYDHYTVNILNVRSMGMGATGVALKGGIESSFLNPAAFKANDFRVYLEANAKGETTEMGRYVYLNEQNNTVTVDQQNLEAGIPGVFLGFGFAPHEMLSIGGSFSTPQTVRYNLFGRLLPTGAFVDRFPAMINYQSTGVLSGHFGAFSAGINLIYNYYTFRDMRVEETFDKVRYEYGTFRFQPGIFYDSPRFTFGLSHKFASEENIDLGNSIIYHTYYDTTLPSVTELGASFAYSDDVTVALAFTYEETSKQYYGFDDRLSLKLGFEKEYEKFNLRGGLMSIPGIYTGRVDLISAQEYMEDVYDPLPRDYEFFVVDKSDQLVLTGGMTYFFPQLNFNMAIAKDLLQNVDLFQLAFSVDIKLGQIIHKTSQRER
jgi:hypothetical protein